MRRTIHFEDDLYFIDELINALDAGLGLNLDGHLFFDKLIEDIFFLDATLNMLTESLDENPQLVQLPQITRNIQIAKQRFTALLDTIIAGEQTMESSFEPFIEKLTALKQSHLEDNERLRIALRDDGEGPTPREGISAEEYQFLFPDDEEQV